jgi:hypothetical protein
MNDNKSYHVTYHTGAGDFDAGDLEEAKVAADEGATYTEQPIEILDNAGNVVARRSWWGVAYDPETTDEPDEIIQFGDFGYYSAWE